MPPGTPPPVRDAATLARPDFTVATLVRDPAAHAAMAESFLAHGFAPERAEYLIWDNSRGNRGDAFEGVAGLIGAARGRYLILCHEDIRLIGDGAEALLACLDDLGRRAPCWAIAGNAGGLADGGLAIRISDPHGEDQRRGALPARVESLDENFLVLRRDAPIGLSRDIGGWHLYGADLCLQARLAGRSAWVIDFHLRHLSAGRVDAGFRASQAAFEAKYGRLLRGPRRLRTTCARLRLGGGWLPRLGGR